MTPLLVLTDRRMVPAGRTLAEVLAAVADGGASTVVLRESDLPDDERAALAVAARAVGLSVIAAHRPVPGCVGLHVRSGDDAVADGPWGRSCHDRAEVERAAADGAGWVTLSPFAPTPSKPGYGPPLATSAWAGLPVPTYALGGIVPANAAEARATGAHGVAVMGAVMRAPDPASVVGALLAAVAS